jgi:predicted MFS family arabinose efflux permease
VQRDRLTLLVYCQLGLWGYFLFGFGPVIPLLRDELEVSNTVAGLHATMIAAGSVTAAALYPWLAHTLGRGLTGRVGIAGLAFGVAALCSVDVLGVTLTGAFIAGGFGSLLVTGSAVILRTRHGARAPAIITEANAVAVAFGLAGPAMVGISEALGLGWRPVLLGVVVLAAAIYVTLGRETVPDPEPPLLTRAQFRRRNRPDPDARLRSRKQRRDRVPAGYWGPWLVVALVIGIEASMVVWSSDLLRDRSGLGDAGAAAGVSVLLGGMFTGRIVGGVLARRREPGGLLLAALGLAGVGWVVFWPATTPWLALVGLAVMGLGMSLHYPLAVTAAIEAGGGRPELAAGRAAMGVGLAGMSVPLAMGAMSDAVDIQAAFLLVPVLIAVAATTVIVSGRRPVGIATLDRGAVFQSETQAE